MYRIEEGAITIKQAAELLEVSYRQARRIAKRFRAEGDAGLVHRSRERVSNRRLSPDLKSKVLQLFAKQFSDYGPTLASEVMAEECGVVVHAETLRRWLHAANAAIARTAHRKHRRKRQRRPSRGEMVQMDGSSHDWFEGRGEPCNLMVAEDDATNYTRGHFSKQETLESAYEMTRQWIVEKGVPESLYVDGKNMYVVDREPTPEEKKAGTGALTDFGRACVTLGIRLIVAHSPQAKGRVERYNGVLQDRLVKALRRKGIGTIDEANAFLPAFFKDFNKRFARPPACEVDRHRKRPSNRILNEVLCRQEERTLQNDWTISYEGRIYQIQDKDCRPRNKVMVRLRYDGTMAILREGRHVRFRLAAT
jgi:transposase